MAHFEEQKDDNQQMQQSSVDYWHLWACFLSTSHLDEEFERKQVWEIEKSLVRKKILQPARWTTH